MNFEELDAYMNGKIQGVCSGAEMALIKEEVEKLRPGAVYLEVGVDEGRSFTIARHYAAPSVYVVGIDINDVPPHQFSVGRGPWAQSQGFIGIGKNSFFIHGDADTFAAMVKPFVKPFVNVLFLDPHHDYESIKANTLSWEPFVIPGGVILYHDFDHPETRKWIEEHHGTNFEVFNGKIVRVRT